MSDKAPCSHCHQNFLCQLEKGQANCSAFVILYLFLYLVKVTSGTHPPLPRARARACAADAAHLLLLPPRETTVNGFGPLFLAISLTFPT